MAASSQCPYSTADRMGFKTEKRRICFGSKEQSVSIQWEVKSKKENSFKEILNIMNLNTGVFCEYSQGVLSWSG